MRSSCEEGPGQSACKRPHTLPRIRSLERRRLQARHIWKTVQPHWPMIKARVWLRAPIHGATRWLQNLYKGPIAPRSSRYELLLWHNHSVERLFFHFLARIGFGFHLDVQISGCFAARGTVEVPTRHPLLSLWKDS